MNKTVAHYRILEKIGEGGMGVVYEAEDTKLKRTVALKFLPPELTKDSQARARFVQEAQAAAALDHPNICSVFEIGEAEGATYIVMPCVKGRSLKDKIAAGPLFLEEVLNIAGQVAEGLKEAHEKGIIHRDIKPGNIMLTEKGQAKIMDFGLAQLIDASTDTHLWAEKYGGTLDDVFDIQEKVSRSIVDALKLKLTPDEAGRLAERPIPSALAYEFYLKARGEILKWTEAGLENALRYLRNGLEIAGENAVLYAGMAYVYFQYFNLGIKEQGFCRKQAEDYVRKAFALDPDCPNASFVRAVLVAWNQPKEGIRCFKRVLDKNPNDFDTLFVFSCLLGTLGRREAVIPFEERTIQIDPLNPAAHFHSGFNRLWEGDYPLALEVLGRLHRSFPGDLLTKWSYGLSLAYMDRKEEAGLIFDEVARENPGTLFACLGLAFKNALEGKRSETMTMLESNPSLQKPWDFQSAYWKTECLALIGEKELALDCLELDVNLGMTNYPLMSERDPLLANIRGEERFKKLMERVKKEWEKFEE